MWPKTSVLGAFWGRSRGTCERDPSPLTFPAKASGNFVNQMKCIVLGQSAADLVRNVARHFWPKRRAWHPRRAISFPAEVPSVSIWLGIQQRVGAEHARQIGRGRRRQERLVELGEARDAEQAEAADHLILEQ